MWIGDLRQIPHLFRKYARHSAPFILAVLTLQTVLAVMTVRWVGVGDESQTPTRIVTLEFLVLFAWISLIGVLGQQDLSVDEKGSRPATTSSWPSFLVAEIAIALCFLNLPVILSDILILNALGLPFRLTHLLLRQLPLLVVVVLPALALSSTSRSIWQFLFRAVIAFLLFFYGGGWLWRFIFERPVISIPLLQGVPDILTITVLALALLLLISIHLSKRTKVTRRLATFAVPIALTGVCFMTHLGQARAFFVARPLEVNGAPDWAKAMVKIRVEKGPATNKRDWWAGIGLPVSIEGLPPELHLRGQGETRIDGLPRPLFSFLLYSEGKGQMTICFVSQRDPFRGKNVSLHTSMELWAFEEKTIYTAAFGTIDLVKIPGVGLCQRGLRSGLNCWFGPLRPVDVSMRIPEEGVIQSWPVSSQISGSIQQQDEVVWGFIPIEKLQGYLPESVSEVPFTKLIPVEHFRTTFSSEGFPLSEYGIHKALTAPLE